MGDRVSIQFKQGEDTSPVLFNHWGGMEFVTRAKRYVKELIKRKEGKTCYPLDRLEPRIVMVDFIRAITSEHDEVESSLYLGKDVNDGDNSDNGHHVINLPKKGHHVIKLPKKG